MRLATAFIMIPTSSIVGISATQLLDRLHRAATASIMIPTSSIVGISATQLLDRLHRRRDGSGKGIELPRGEEATTVGPDAV